MPPQKKIDVFVEKPVVLNSSEYQRATKSVTDNGTHLYFGYHLPFKPSFIRFKEMLMQNVTVGKDKITKFDVEYTENSKNSPNSSWMFSQQNSGGGCLMDSGINVLACLEEILGKITPTSVTLSSDGNSTV